MGVYNLSRLCRELRHEEVSFYLYLLLAATRPTATRLAVTRLSATPLSASQSLVYERLRSYPTNFYSTQPPATASAPQPVVLHSWCRQGLSAVTHTRGRVAARRSIFLSFSSSTPCGDTPCGDTPCGDTPCGDTPCGDTPCGHALRRHALRPHALRRHALRPRPAATRPAATPCGDTPCGHALRRHALRPHAMRPHALRLHALRRHALRRRAFSAMRSLSLAFEAVQPRLPKFGLWTSVFLSNQLLINTTSGHGIHATASRPSQLKVSQRRQTPAGLDAGGMTTMPETPVKCHHTRWQSSRPPSCTRLISQRLDAASVELWSSTHWLPVG